MDMKIIDCVRSENATQLNSEWTFFAPFLFRMSDTWGKTFDQRLLSCSQFSKPLHLKLNLPDSLTCKVCLSSSATLIIGPAPPNKATVTDNKHIILRVMTVKHLYLHQKIDWGNFYSCIWPHQSKIVSNTSLYRLYS